MDSQFDSDERMTRIRSLELKRQDELHGIELVQKDEELRRLKLEAIAFKDEHAALQDHAAQKDAECLSLQHQQVQTRLELDDATRITRRLNTEAKMRDHEIMSLKTENETLNNAMEDSGKAMQEKFALTRELNRLRPELERLQSQVSNHQSVIAEKQSLQRQLNSLEVELENEKRARQHTKGREDNEAIDALKAQLQEAEKRLATDRKERQKMKKEHEKAMNEASRRCEELEGLISTMKAESEAAEASLEAAEPSVHHQESIPEMTQPESEAEQESEPEPKPKARMQGKTTKTPAPAKARRRGAKGRAEDDMVAQTPEGGDTERRPTKKRGAEYAPIGEKSTFSITPFLNRPKNVLGKPAEIPSPESVKAKAPVPAAKGRPKLKEAHDEAFSDDAAPVSKRPPAAAEVKAAKAKGRPQTKPLRETSPNKGTKEVPAKQTAPSPVKRSVQFTSPKKQLKSCLKPAVAAPGSEPDASAGNDSKEEADGIDPEEDSAQSLPGKGPQKTSNPTKAAAAADKPSVAAPPAPGTKRKRALLGGANTTIFDEEDEEAEAIPPPKAQLGGKRRLKAPLGGLGGGFGAGTFSPLKRQKRGVNASFLG